jgi:2-keto-4-pentenoate hydratase
VEVWAVEKQRAVDCDAAEAAEILRRAAETGQAVPRVVPDVAAQDQELAYSIQEINTAYWLTEGRVLVGRKIGLTSPVVQKQLGVDRPDYGMLFADMAVLDDAPIPTGRLIQPKAEAEVAFVMAQDVNTPLYTMADLMPAVDFALPAIEVVDSRIENWNINLANTIADNASSALFVLGAETSHLAGLDLRKISMTMRKGNEIVSQGSGADCLGNPVHAVLWLARKMVEVGSPLKAGDIVLSGALGPMVAARPGDVFEAVLEGLGTVRARFAD